jgi:hypothetical protein
MLRSLTTETTEDTEIREDGLDGGGGVGLEVMALPGRDEFTTESTGLNGVGFISVTLFHQDRLGGDWDGLRGAQDHFVDGSSGGDHGIDVFVGGDLDVEEVGAGFFDGFLEGAGEFGGSFDGSAFEAVGSGEEFDVREAFEFDGARPVVIEKLLPLANHAQVTVIHDNDFDGEAECYKSR